MQGLLKRWFAHKSSNPEVPSVCVCCGAKFIKSFAVLISRVHTRAHANERSLRKATADSLAFTSNQAATRAALHLPRDALRAALAACR